MSDGVSRTPPAAETERHADTLGRLSDAEARFRAIFEQQHQHAAIIRTDGTVVDVNQRALDLGGLSLDEVCGRAFWDTAWWARSEDQRQRLREAIAEAARGRTAGFEAVIPRPDGATSFVDFSLRPIFGTGGDVSFLVAESVDVTAQRQAEKQGDLIANSVPVLVSFVDTDERYRFTNAAYERYFAVPKNALIGKRIVDVIGEEAYGHEEKHIRAALAGTRSSFRGKLNIAGVGEQHLHIDWVPHKPDGKVTGFYTIVNDVTELKFAEAQLERGAARLQSLVETTQDGVVFVDPEARIVGYNPSAARIFGYDRDEVIGEKVTMLMPDAFASEDEPHIQHDQRTGEPHAIGHIRTVWGRRKSGERFPIELSVTELMADDDVRYAAFIRDISEKVRLQQQAIQDAQLATVGTTASMFAHEVGNPLNNMYLYAQLLSRRLRKRDVGDDVLGDLDRIMEEVRRLNRLLDEFRSFYRKNEVQLEPVHLGALADEVLGFLENGQGNAKPPVRIERDLPDDLPPVVASKDKVKQVLVNLCKNAFEAMPDGGTLALRINTTADSARIEVRDTGAGIDEGVDVFQPFRTTKPTGSGLGLPVVRQIVQAYGGSVSFESTLGKGTTFVVVLPLIGPGAPS